jgi:transcription factor C subunit 7
MKKHELFVTTCPISYSRYSTAKAGTGLHPRPGPKERLQQFFPDGLLSMEYSSTVYPSRRGETLAELQARCDLVSSDVLGIP